MNGEVTGIILTAGIGSRLGVPTKDRPKGLVLVNGRPLLDYNIHFLRACGVKQIVAVAGFEAGKVRAYLASNHPEVRVVENKEYLKGNLYSLKEALKSVKGSILLSNADHLYKNSIAEAVNKQCNGVTAFCDWDRNLQDDDMKVLRNERGNLKEIAKTLTNFDCGYAGLTYCAGSARGDYDKALTAVENKFGEKAVAEQVLGEMAGEELQVKIGDISGHGWLEIDFPHELEAARLQVAKNSQLYFL